MATHEILGTDIYREGASMAFGVPYAKVTSGQRETFKERFLMLGYGFGTSRENIREHVKRVASMMRTQIR
jgi:hypothetical protein